MTDERPLTAACWSCGRAYADEAEVYCGWCGAEADAARAETAGHAEGWPDSCPTCRRAFGAPARAETAGLDVERLRTALDSFMTERGEYRGITAEKLGAEYGAARAETAGLREVLLDLLTATENAAFSALAEAEDGSEEPEWQTRLWDAADNARAALAAEHPT